MKTRTLLTVFLLIFSTTTIFAQQHKEDIKRRFDEFWKLTATGDIEKSMNYIPDTLFTIIPKGQMITMMTAVLNNKDLEYHILDYKITDVGDSKLVNNTHYSILKYTSNMTMKFKNIDTINAADKRKEALNLINLSLGNTFGSGNVKLDESSGTFFITAYKKSCAVASNKQTDWKFINIEARQRLILDKIIPKEIIDSI